jgi:ribulose-5-phosphate 4-epimerase/fuculose-1-phosphate aldolase
VSEYVKFACDQATTEITPFGPLAELNAYRRKLLQLRLIGVDANGIGFGNLSIRDGTTNNFYVTGSATGGKTELTLADCARVVAYDFEKNWLRYEGSTIPSSESLTHAAVYESDSTAGSVIHCHDSTLWTALLNHAPTSSKAVEYGTPAMASEVARLFKITDVQSRKILVMAGHERGIVAFGKDLEEAFAVLVRERREKS